MSECSKVAYSSRGAALFAMRAIAQAKRARGRTGPRGTYVCGSCRCWHLTSGAGMRKPPWERRRIKPPPAPDATTAWSSGA
jgi:hypothetical protein